MNKRTWLAFGVATALVFGASAANAQDGRYLNAQLVAPDVDEFSGGLGIALAYGQEVPNILPNLAIEGEFTTTLSNPDTSVPGGTAEASYFTVAGYAVYSHPLNDQFSLRGRLGLLYIDAEVDVPGQGSESDTDFGLSFGVGATYEINAQLGANAEFTVVESDVNHLSAGIQYRF